MLFSGHWLLLMDVYSAVLHYLCYLFNATLVKSNESEEKRKNYLLKMKRIFFIENISLDTVSVLPSVGLIKCQRTRTTTHAHDSSGRQNLIYRNNDCVGV